jgi:hypothetical protein
VDFHDAATLPQHPNIGLGLALVVFMKSFALGLIVGLVLAAPLVSILFLLQAIVGTPFRLDARNFTYASFRLDPGFMALRLAIPTRKTRLSRALLRWSRSCTNRGSSGTAPERRQRHLQRPAKPLRDSSKAQVWSSRPCFAQPVETEAHYGAKTATPSKIDGRGLGISAGRTNPRALVGSVMLCQEPDRRQFLVVLFQ